MSMLLYQIIHIESGHKYVGQTSRAAIRRWREHLYKLRKNKHDNRYLQYAWNKYGESAFEFQIVKEFNSLEELNEAEIELIKNGSNLYNLAEGGNGFQHKNGARKAIGEANRKPIMGMCVKTGEIKEYTSAADAAKDGFDPACIRKCVLGSISKRKDGTSFESVSHKGWVWESQETATKNSLAVKCDIAKMAKVRKERQVIGMNIFTKEIRQFRSASEAGRNGFRTTNIHRSCNQNNAVHKGFVWVYGDIDNPQSLLEDKVRLVFSLPKRGPKSWQ